MTGGRDRRAGGVVIINPSAFAWMPHLAAGVARAGLLRAYISPFGVTSAGLSRISSVAPAGVVETLALRSLPPDVEPWQVERVGALSNLLSAAALRFAPRRLGQVNELHAGRFDRATAKRLRPEDELVVGYAATSVQTFRRAEQLGITKVLDYPITHHAHNVAVMREEAALVPEYAHTIQGAEYTDVRWATLEDQVALADYLIALGTAHRESFLAAGVPEQKLIDHPLGVDATLFRPAPRPADGVFRVAFSGQITQRKGISYLVEGFSKAAIPGSELIMIGTPVGSTKPWASQPGVRHVPSVKRHELPSVYAGADVFVMPSLLEGCCQTPLEAMAMGLPTIVTPNTFDVITDGVDGLVVPIRDSDAIAERLRALHQDQALARRLGEQGRRTAERHDWRLYGDEMAEMLGGVIAGRPAG